MRVSTAFNRMLGLSGRMGQGCGVRRAGGDRHGRVTPQTAGLLGLRSARAESQGSPRHALAALGCRRGALPHRVPAQTAVLPGLRRSPRACRVGARRRAVHPRFRRHDRVAGAADEPDAGHPADADRRETVGNILQRVVAEKLPAGGLDGLELIGVDEVSYGADHRFLTCVANHGTGGIVWATEGRNAASLQAFFNREAINASRQIEEIDREKPRR